MVWLLLRLVRGLGQHACALGQLAHVAVFCALLATTACKSDRVVYLFEGDEQEHYRAVATEIDTPDVDSLGEAAAEASRPPRTLWTHEPADYWDLSLAEAVSIALENSRVMRDLGGTVVRNPARLSTVYDPAIQESDPRFGVESALSRFDTQFSTQVFWERNDRFSNNLLLGGGIRELRQDVGDFRTQIFKQTAVGSQLALRHNVDYDWNNRPTNAFPSAWQTNVEAEVRQPLLKGAGVEFNRIAGPNAQPGFYYQNGVVLARIDHDISLADFESGVQKLASDVENAYWDLYFAYRDLDAKIAARDSSLQTWRKVNRLREQGERGGEAAAEAQAAAQYFFFRAEVENALSGTPLGSTQSGIGTSSGTFLGAGGVYARENNLRLLLGLPNNDGRLIRPHDEPATSRVIFDWEAILAEAVARRVDVRRQKWTIKRREMELIAARNFLKPRLDAVARYRWRGFGDDLIEPDSEDASRFDNAYQNLTDGDFQEWQLGLQLELPIGLREGHAAVRNAEWKLARERAILDDQERQVAHDLAVALRELHRADVVRQTHFDGRRRAADRVEAVRREYEAGLTTVDRLLEAQKDLAEAEVLYFRALVAHELAIKAVHFEKGSLLDYNEIQLAEGPWPAGAYRDAQRLARQRAAACNIDYALTLPPIVSRGPYSQQTAPAELPAEEVESGRPLPELELLPDVSSGSRRFGTRPSTEDFSQQPLAIRQPPAMLPIAEPTGYELRIRAPSAIAQHALMSASQHDARFRSGAINGMLRAAGQETSRLLGASSAPFVGDGKPSLSGPILPDLPPQQEATAPRSFDRPVVERRPDARGPLEPPIPDEPGG